MDLIADLRELHWTMHSTYADYQARGDPTKQIEEARERVDEIRLIAMVVFRLVIAIFDAFTLAIFMCLYVSVHPDGTLCVAGRDE